MDGVEPPLPPHPAWKMSKFLWLSCTNGFPHTDSTLFNNFSWFEVFLYFGEYCSLVLTFSWNNVPSPDVQNSFSLLLSLRTMFLLHSSLSLRSMLTLWSYTDDFGKSPLKRIKLMVAIGAHSLVIKTASVMFLKKNIWILVRPWRWYLKVWWRAQKV